MIALYHKHSVRGAERIAARIALLMGALALTTDAGVILPATLLTQRLVA